MEFVLNFGLLAPSIKDQCAEQGFPVDDDFSKQEKIRTSIAMLNAHGYLTDGEANKKRNKLINEIVEVIERRVSK